MKLLLKKYFEKKLPRQLPQIERDVAGQYVTPLLFIGYFSGLGLLTKKLFEHRLLPESLLAVKFVLWLFYPAALDAEENEGGKANKNQADKDCSDIHTVPPLLDARSLITP